MRRFRQSLKEPQYRCYDPSYDTKHLKDEVYFLSVLDSCSQILRDDRIWLRKKVKENDLDVLGILRNAVRGTNKQINMINLKQLQINLRKHINKTKQRLREEQLIKFKENVLANQLKKRKGGRDSELEANISVSKNRGYGKLKHDSSYSLPRQSSFLSKLHYQPIQQEESSEKTNSYPSRSSEPFAQYHKQINRSAFIYKRDIERITPLSRRSSNQQDFLQTLEPRESVKAMKQSKSNAVLNTQKLRYDKQFKKPQKQIEKNRSSFKNSKLDTHREKEQLITFKPSQTVERQPKPQPPTKKQAVKVQEKYPSPQQEVITDMSMKQCQMNSYTFGPILGNANATITINNSPQVSQIEYSRASLNFPPSSQDEQSLFTSPQLLMQCRLFIERNSTTKKRKDPKPDNSILPQSTLNLSQSNDFKQSQRFNDTLKIENYQFVDQDVSAPEQMASVEIPKRVIENELAEDVFVQLFGENRVINNLHQLLEQKFQKTPTLMNIINRTGNEILPEELGSVLQVYCPQKELNNSVRELYNYIDLDQNGYVTIEDLQAFLGQVLESQDDPMYQLGVRIFERTQREGKVQYWSLYQIKETDDMKQFVKFLSQFQFEVEA